MSNPNIFFLISAQHFIPTGGIGSFFRGFVRMSNQLGWDVICILDKKPPGQCRHMMEAIPSVQYVWPIKPISYKEHNDRGLYAKEIINPTKVANFEDSVLIALNQCQPDLIVINTPEAAPAVLGIQQLHGTRTLFYSHHENFVVPPEKASKVFDPSYNEFLYCLPLSPNLELATQSEFNIQRMGHLKFANSPLVLPMPLPDLQLLDPYNGQREGVLFIGRHEPRKNPKLFAKIVAQAGLPAKVLTNKRGVDKFEKIFAKAGISNFDIRYELTGKTKSDFIKSAKVAFHPAILESYGFSAMETLAAGLPTLLLDNTDWWQAFKHLGVHTTPKLDAAAKLKALYNQPNSTSPINWTAIEASTQNTWADLLD
jgi:glycosyltransferase involved in cell wall biosynthesis